MGRHEIISRTWDDGENGQERPFWCGQACGSVLIAGLSRVGSGQAGLPGARHGESGDGRILSPALCTNPPAGRVRRRSLLPRRDGPHAGEEMQKRDSVDFTLPTSG